MNLRILVPDRVVLERGVAKVIAEAVDGTFCILPRRLDCLAQLLPGILSFLPEDSPLEEYVAVDRGILVKCGSEVLVSTYRAIHSEDLEELREAVDERFIELEEEEKKTRSAVAKLEADLVKRFYEMGKHGR